MSSVLVGNERLMSSVSAQTVHDRPFHAEGRKHGSTVGVRAIEITDAEDVNHPIIV